MGDGDGSVETRAGRDARRDDSTRVQQRSVPMRTRIYLPTYLPRSFLASLPRSPFLSHSHTRTHSFPAYLPFPALLDYLPSLCPLSPPFLLSSTTPTTQDGRRMAAGL